MGLAIRQPLSAPIGGGGPPPPGARPDDALDTIAKIVPADALALYVALVAIAPGKNEDWWTFAFFLIGLVAAGAFLMISAKKNQDKPPWWQLPLRLAAFAIYALVISAPLKPFFDLDPRFPHAALVLVTAFAGVLGYSNTKT
jgi:hypothetical protein